MVEQLLKRLKEGDLKGLGDTNLAIELPISGRLIQEVLDNRPPGGPMESLDIQLLAQDRAILNIVADAPVVGKIRRELSLQLSGEYDRDSGGLIVFDIVDGLKIFDKPVINLLQRQVESKLPAGIDLNAKRVTIDLPKLLKALGYGYLLGLLAGGKMATRKDQLILFLHLKA